MRISDWSSDVCSSDLGLIFIISVLLFQFRASRLDSLLYPNDVVGGCGIIERISEFASGFGVQMQEWLAPFDLLAETCLHVDASGLDVGRAGQLGEARQLAIIDMDDRSEEHTSELQSLMRISYAVFCLKKKTK